MRSLTQTALLVLGFVSGPLAQAIPPVTLQVDVSNFVIYEGDVFDYSRFATSPGLLPAPANRTFGTFTAIADIVNINGKAARGALVFRTTRLPMSPTPQPGQPIADVIRGTVSEWTFEILQADGTQVGTFVALGFPNGDPPPGAPRNSVTHNMAIVGGTGAFLGVRGQVGQAATPFTLPATAATRRTSLVEDPSMRRVNGGINVGFILQFIPLERPELVDAGLGAAILHSDFSPVTASNPARPGETIVLTVRGLGPTTPALDADQVFPSSPLASATSPVEVTVNGEPAVVINKVGFPGSTDVYRVDLQLPQGTTAGMVRLRIAAAWVPSPDITLPVAAR
jgi:hypothetical protein